MSREGWVHPPLVAVEPLPRHVRARRRRLASAALVVALLGALTTARATLAAPAQDPGVVPSLDSPSASSGPTRSTG